MEMLEHQIICDGKGVIAVFANESDRDIALDALKKTYPDCEFVTHKTEHNSIVVK